MLFGLPEISQMKQNQFLTNGCNGELPHSLKIHKQGDTGGSSKSSNVLARNFKFDGISLNSL